MTAGIALEGAPDAPDRRADPPAKTKGLPLAKPPRRHECVHAPSSNSPRSAKARDGSRRGASSPAAPSPMSLAIPPLCCRRCVVLADAATSRSFSFGATRASRTRRGRGDRGPAFWRRPRPRLALRTGGARGGDVLSRGGGGSARGAHLLARDQMAALGRADFSLRRPRRKFHPNGAEAWANGAVSPPTPRRAKLQRRRRAAVGERQAAQGMGPSRATARRARASRNPRRRG